MSARARCTAFLRWALPRLGMRWAGFRKVRGQVCKRISRRIQELGLGGFDAYRRHLEGHPEEWAVLDGLCRVTITRFHRDRGVFELLREEVLPALAEREGEGERKREVLLRAWSAGCASGEEPYTLALAERLDPTLTSRGIRLHITATDADPHLLARARRGRYPMGALRDLPAGWVEESFTSEMELDPEIREAVVFLEQDLRYEMPDGPFHLILCRNLAFTYFDEALRRETLERLTARLVLGGVLVLGAHETLPAEEAGSAPAGDGSGAARLRRIRPGEPVYRLEGG
ncbi:MAG: chemotaxis protein CheR [Gemmatimonadales bacterium]|nr:MAG: chemotaxis protein CheR [Gemmatimonadales bacterium]